MDFAHLERFHVRTEEEEQVVFLKLNHGKANEFGRVELRELDTLCDAIHANKAIRALIVFSSKTTATDKRVFSAGANVTERVTWSIPEVKDHMRWQRSTMVKLRMLPVFSIAVIDGLAQGLGAEFMVTMDWRIGTPNARFGLPETGLGIVPGALGTAELATRIGVSNSLYLGLTGETVGSDEALKMGLLNEVVPIHDKGLQRARKLAHQVIKRSPRAVAAFKGAVLRGLGEALEARLEREARAYEGLIDSGDAAIGRTHFHSIRKGKPPCWPPRDPPSK